MIQFKDIIAQHGGDPGSYFAFDDDDDQIHLLPYTTLTTARTSASELAPLLGVYEWQNAPLFMLVDGDQLPNDADAFARLRRIVAMRGDAPYLAVLQAGRVTFYDVSLDNRDRRSAKAIDDDIANLGLLIANVANNRPGKRAKEKWISDVILKLLTDALDALTALGIDSADAISLVGRSLFVRFLADRGLLDDQNFVTAAGSIEALFDNSTNTAQISAWLDETFNGDFLPLPTTRIAALPPEAFNAIANIMRRAKDGQLPLKWEEDWANLDFSHIPVGVLSQAYEQYLGRHQKTKQKKEGSFYTPRHIADLMVHAAFAAMQRNGKAHCAKILDPAAGAGVFLITAFRQLVKERWRFDDKRPNTEALREILYGQIRGFDINDSALRFAALGLYLISIELDPAPKPVKKLKFEKDLRQRVLFKLGKDDNIHGSKDLGSLGDEIGPEHNAQYDLVIGNPPWSSNTKLPDWKDVTYRVKMIAQARLGDPKISASLPNEALDLPFVWRAMEWAKPDAQLAFALHGRLLFQRGEGMDVALSALLRAINVTGIINGAEVRKSKVWPTVDAPFCLLFARNNLPGPGAAFRFISPHLEGPLNQTGGWRIDAAQADHIAIDDVLQKPWLLKARYRGTMLDQEIFERVAAKGVPSFGRYWADLHGGTQGQPKCSGNGYKRLFETSRKPPSEGGKQGYSAEGLYLLKVLGKGDFIGVLLNTERFRKFADLGLERLDQKRDAALYKGPMLLAKKSAPAGKEPRIKTAVSLNDLVFNETYYGYTAHQHEHGANLARYLCLVIGSKFALWNCLITSGEFGVEREVIEKYIMQEVPLPAYEELAPSDHNKIEQLFANLAQADTSENWRDVDIWVASLLELSEDDVQTISDTLAVALPFSAQETAARAQVKLDLKTAYCSRLETELRPWVKHSDRELSVKPVQTPLLSPWEFVAVSIGYAGSSEQFDSALKTVMQNAADVMSSSEIIYRDDAHDCLYLGRLNQARYWTISQARLAARRIIWDHADFLSGERAI